MAELIQIKLKHPIDLDNARRLETIGLRRPTAGDLRGGKLAQLLQLDIDAMAEVVARISEPLLPAWQFYRLDPVDLTEVAMAVAGFFTAGASPSA